MIRFCDFGRAVVAVAFKGQEFKWETCKKYFLIRHQPRPTFDHYTLEYLTPTYTAGGH
jgi:hypothetical protein